MREMSLEEFCKRLYGFVGGFRVHTERAIAKHPGLFPDKMTFGGWMRAFLHYVRTPRRARPPAAAANSIDETKQRP